MDTLSQVLADFGVDWPKFIAQVILFLIVYAVLSKFAFRPVVLMLEERRRRIEQAQADARAVKEQLAAAEARYAEILAKANDDAQRLIEGARVSGEGFLDRKTKEAVAEAEGVLRRAREAVEQDRERMLVELKREVGRLVVETTAKIAGKALTPEDQRRLAGEAAKEIAA